MEKRILKDYKEKGYAILDNFLPEKVAIELAERYAKNSKWELQDQVRPDHYKHVFATNNPYLPRSNETYKAKFDRARELEKSEYMKTLFQTYFVPRLNEVADKPLTQIEDIRCYRLLPGHFYRTHIDDYAAAVGLTYYINREWGFDWGGLLHIASSNDMDFIDTVFPKFNRIVLLNHGKFRFPHFVSTVSEYALNPRYTIVAFCK